jgi:hypothetical protein
MQPGKPGLSWSGADSRSRQPDSGSPRAKGNRRPRSSGGALKREHQAAVAAGRPWPPERTPQREPEPVLEPESSPAANEEAEGQSGPYDQAGRRDVLLAHVTEAAKRFAGEHAGRAARAEYAAGLKREASAEPEHTAQAEASYEAEIEL